MNRSFVLPALVVGAWLGSTAPSRAAIVVLANRTNDVVSFELTGQKEKPQDHKLLSGDSLTLPWTTPVGIAFGSGPTRRSFQLEPNSAYYFAQVKDELSFHEIGLGNRPGRATAATPALATKAAPGTIKVQILVDEEEPGVQHVWEKRLRERIEAASAILEKQCQTKLEVVAVGTWESDNAVTAFGDLYYDFVRKVRPPGEALAIGFSSQRLPMQGKTHLGGIQMPLQRHILIREWFPRSEIERLEVLLHELGHYLGAAHSAEITSVMRPLLGDGRANARYLRAPFDPVNTLVMNLVAEELRERPIRNLGALSVATRERLGQIYGEMAKTQPDDPTPPKYLRLLNQAAVAGSTVAQPRTLIQCAQAVLAAITTAAEENRRLPLSKAADGEEPMRRRGDALTAYYVQKAASATRKLPAEQRAKAFLLALGIALDTSDLMRLNPVTRGLWRMIESDAERKNRLEVIGEPTVHVRHDLCQHFVVSCALTVMLGSQAAEAAGVLKEMLDSQPGGSGFSFADSSADLAGVAFATQIIKAPELLDELATSFAVKDYAIPPTGLPEDLSREAFAKAYGSTADERFKTKQESIRKAILALPGFQRTSHAGKQ